MVRMARWCQHACGSPLATDPTAPRAMRIVSKLSACEYSLPYDTFISSSGASALTSLTAVESSSLEGSMRLSRHAPLSGWASSLTGSPAAMLADAALWLCCCSCVAVDTGEVVGEGHWARLLCSKGVSAGRGCAAAALCRRRLWIVSQRLWPRRLVQVRPAGRCRPRSTLQTKVDTACAVRNPLCRRRQRYSCHCAVWPLGCPPPQHNIW